MKKDPEVALEISKIFKLIKEISPGKTVEFYLKLTREQSAQLNTWNCSKIVALSNDSKTLSNELTIESYIPNPKDFN